MSGEEGGSANSERGNLGRTSFIGNKGGYVAPAPAPPAPPPSMVSGPAGGTPAGSSPDSGAPAPADQSGSSRPANSS
jgi:hypothetical protein